MGRAGQAAAAAAGPRGRMTAVLRRSPSQSSPGLEPAAPPPAIGRRDRLIALALLALCALLYYRAPAHQVFDWRFSTAVSHSLLHEGRLTVPPELLERAKYQLQEIDGRVYHLYPVAPSLLNVPFLAVCEWLGTALYDENGRFDLGEERGVLKISAAVVTAGTVALLFLVARLFVGRGWALALALLFAFGTGLFSTASRPYWSHAWALFFLALGLYCLLAPSDSRRFLRDAAGASALSWAFFCRPTLAVSVLVLTIFAVADRRRRLLPLALVGGAWAALYVAFSLYHFGQPLPPYFDTPQAPSGHLRLDGLLRLNPEAALATLFSPARGLFVFTPILLVILLALSRAWPALGRRQRRLAVAGLAVVVLHWHLVSSLEFWRGGAGYGPRLLTELLPWFLVLAALAAAATRARAARGWKEARLWAVAAVLTAAASLFVHFRGGTDRNLVRHFGIWNWRYPPFVAGLVAYPGASVPGAELIYSAELDRNPRDGWSNATRRRGFDMEMAAGVAYRRLRGAAVRGAFVFDGSGGGTMAPLRNLGWEPNVTARAATFEIWFRPAAAGDDRQVLFETGARGRGMTIFVERGRPGVEVRDGGAPTSVKLVAPGPVSRGEPSQLAVLLRTADEGFELELRVNAERVAGPLPAPAIANWAGGNGSGLGTAANLPSLPGGEFHGEIALFRFYPGALDEKQLRRNLGARLGRGARGRR